MNYIQYSEKDYISDVVALLIIAQVVYLWKRFCAT